MPPVNKSLSAETKSEVLAPGRLDETIGYQLRLAQILAYRAFEDRVSQYGVAPRYLGLLGIVAAHPGQPQSRLAEALGLQRSSLVTILDRLEKDGLLERKATKTDRRTNSLSLTAHGHQVLQELEVEALRHEEELCAGLSAKEREVTVDGLRKIVAGLR